MCSEMPCPEMSYANMQCLTTGIKLLTEQIIQMETCYSCTTQVPSAVPTITQYLIAIKTFFTS